MVQSPSTSILIAILWTIMDQERMPTLVWIPFKRIIWHLRVTEQIPGRMPCPWLRVIWILRTWRTSMSKAHQIHKYNGFCVSRQAYANAKLTAIETRHIPKSGSTYHSNGLRKLRLASCWLLVLAVYIAKARFSVGVSLFFFFFFFLLFCHGSIVFFIPY